MEAKKILIWRDKMDPNMFSIGYQWQTSFRVLANSPKAYQMLSAFSKNR